MPPTPWPVVKSRPRNQAPPTPAFAVSVAVWTSILGPPIPTPTARPSGVAVKTTSWADGPPVIWAAITAVDDSRVAARAADAKRIMSWFPFVWRNGLTIRFPLPVATKDSGVLLTKGLGSVVVKRRTGYGYRRMRAGNIDEQNPFYHLAHLCE